MRFFETHILEWLPLISGGLTAALAAYITIYPPSEANKVSWKYAFLLLFLFFVVVSRWQSAVVAKDRSREAQDKIESESKRDGIIADGNKRIANLQESMKILLNAADEQAAFNSPKKPHPTLAPKTLDERASFLAHEITNFIVQRQAEEPPMPRVAHWESDIALIVKFGARTTELFKQRFEDRLLGIRNELMKQGLTDDDFERCYLHPVNWMIMQTIASRLGFMAEQSKHQRLGQHA